MCRWGWEQEGCGHGTQYLHTFCKNSTELPERGNRRVSFAQHHTYMDHPAMGAMSSVEDPTPRRRREAGLRGTDESARVHNSNDIVQHLAEHSSLNAPHIGPSASRQVSFESNTAPGEQHWAPVRHTPEFEHLEYPDTIANRLERLQYEFQDRRAARRRSGSDPSVREVQELPTSHFSWTTADEDEIGDYADGEDSSTDTDTAHQHASHPDEPLVSRFSWSTGENDETGDNEDQEDPSANAASQQASQANEQLRSCFSWSTSDGVEAGDDDGEEQPSTAAAYQTSSQANQTDELAQQGHPLSPLEAYGLSQLQGRLHGGTNLPESPTHPGYQSMADQFPALGNAKKVSAVWQTQSDLATSREWRSSPEEEETMRSIAEDLAGGPLSDKTQHIHSKQPATQSSSPKRTTVKPTRVPQPVKMPARHQAVPAEPSSPVDMNSPAQRLMREHNERDRLRAQEAAKKAAEPPTLPPPPKDDDFPSFGTPKATMGAPGSNAYRMRDSDVPSASASKSSWARIASGPSGSLVMKPSSAAAKSAPRTDSEDLWPRAPTHTQHWDDPHPETTPKSSQRAPHFAQPTQATARRADQTMRRGSTPAKPSPEASPSKLTKGKAPDFETEKRAAHRKRTSLPVAWTSPTQAPASPSKSAGKKAETTTASPQVEASSQPASHHKKPSTYMSPTKATQQRSLATIGDASVPRTPLRIKTAGLRIDTSPAMIGVERPWASSPDWATSGGRFNTPPVFAQEGGTQDVPKPHSPNKDSPRELPIDIKHSSSTASPLSSMMLQAKPIQPLANVSNTSQTRRASRTDMLRPIIGTLVKHDLFKTATNTAIARTSGHSGLLGPVLDRVELTAGLMDVSNAEMKAAAKNVDQAMQQSPQDQQAPLKYLQKGIERETKRRATLSRPSDRPIFNSPSGLRGQLSHGMSRSIQKQIMLALPSERQQAIIFREMGLLPDKRKKADTTGLRTQFSANIGAEIQDRINKKEHERRELKIAQREETERERKERMTSERRTQSEPRQPVGMASPPEDPAIVYTGHKPPTGITMPPEAQATPKSEASSNGKASASSSLRATAAVFRPQWKLEPPKETSAAVNDAGPAGEERGDGKYRFKPQGKLYGLSPAEEFAAQADDADDAFMGSYGIEPHRLSHAERFASAPNMEVDAKLLRLRWAGMQDRARFGRLSDAEWDSLPTRIKARILARRNADRQGKQTQEYPGSTPARTPNNAAMTSRQAGRTNDMSWEIRGDGGQGLYTWTGRNGMEISFRGHGPAAERDPRSLVSYNRNAATTHVQPAINPDGSEQLIPDAPLFMRIAYAKRNGLSRVPCNELNYKSATFSPTLDLHQPAHCAVCEMMPGSCIMPNANLMPGSNLAPGLVAPPVAVAGPQYGFF